MKSNLNYRGLLIWLSLVFPCKTIGLSNSVLINADFLLVKVPFPGLFNILFEFSLAGYAKRLVTLKFSFVGPILAIFVATALNVGSSKSFSSSSNNDYGFDMSSSVKSARDPSILTSNRHSSLAWVNSGRFILSQRSLTTGLDWEGFWLLHVFESISLSLFAIFYGFYLRTGFGLSYHGTVFWLENYLLSMIPFIS